MGRQRVMGVGRVLVLLVVLVLVVVGEKGLLLGGVGVGVWRPGAVHAEAASDQRRPAEPVAPPAQAVGAGPAIFITH